MIYDMSCNQAHLFRLLRFHLRPSCPLRRRYPRPRGRREPAPRPAPALCTSPADVVESGDRMIKTIQFTRYPGAFPAKLTYDCR